MKQANVRLGKTYLVNVGGRVEEATVIRCEFPPAYTTLRQRPRRYTLRLVRNPSVEIVRTSAGLQPVEEK